MATSDDSQRNRIEGKATIKMAAPRVSARGLVLLRDEKIAPIWWGSMEREAEIVQYGTGDWRGARLREAVLAFCFLDTYLVEWVRDKVVPKTDKDIETYFPSGKRGREVWKHAIKEAGETLNPDSGYPFGNTEWYRLTCLWELRNDLVHANVSKQETSNKTLIDIYNKRAGYARDIVKEFVKALNCWAGTTLPDYF